MNDKNLNISANDNVKGTKNFNKLFKKRRMYMEVVGIY